MILLGILNSLKKLIGTQSKAENSPADRQEGQRPVTTELDDVVEGYRFSAKMSTSTPLWILEKHGEIHPGPESALPRYGTESDSRLREFMTWREMGVGAREMAGSMMDSMLGPIPDDGGEFLPFLKQFRVIVESDEDVDAKTRLLSQLSISTAANRSITEKIAPDLGRWWFTYCLSVCMPPEVNFELVERFYAAKLCTVEEIQAASDEVLLGISGLGSDTLKEIRDSLKEIQDSR